MLGFSLPLASKGLNVRVYRDRIAATAVSRGVSEPDLLAHVIAHEIGHVLLRSGAHEGNGLMAAVWKAHEYAWIQTSGLNFGREETAVIRATINGEGCSAEVSAKH